MKAKDLKDRSVDDLSALEKELQGQFFENRLKNFTNRLDDTSLIRKTKRDIARVKTVLAQKSNAKAGS
jgi:large subunit ribosomal protein L29